VQVISPEGKKDHLLDLVTRLAEGKHKKYIAGSGETPWTSRRVLIYRREGNVQKNKRPPRRSAADREMMATAALKKMKTQDGSLNNGGLGGLGSNSGAYDSEDDDEDDDDDDDIMNSPGLRHQASSSSALHSGGGGRHELNPVFTGYHARHPKFNYPSNGEAGVDSETNTGLRRNSSSGRGLHSSRSMSNSSLNNMGI
jgi:hypothetical protein